MRGSDLAIALAGGAAGGFFDNAAAENKSARLQQEKEREAQLLALKDQRIAAREMAKQKDQQAFDLTKMGKEQEYKTQESQRKTAGEFMSKQSENEFEMEKLTKKHGYDKELEGIKQSGKKKDEDLILPKDKAKIIADIGTLESGGVDARVAAISNPLRKMAGMPLLKKVVTPGKKGTFSDEPDKEDWVEDTGEGQESQSTVSKFSSILSKVAGKGTRTKTGANDSGDIVQPAPIPGTYDEQDLPMNFN